jgi:dienelactone hydrolase
MKVVALSAYLAVCIMICEAQKPPLNYDAIIHWPQINSEGISNDGNYLLYGVGENRRPEIGEKLVIQTVDNSLKVEIQNVTDAVFTEDSRRVIFVNTSDSLGILDLSTNHKDFIPNILSFKLPSQGGGRWLACALGTKEVLLLDLVSMKKTLYPNAEDYLFDERGNVLLIERKSIADSGKTEFLQRVDLADGNALDIWHGLSAKGFAFDRAGGRLAFVGASQGDPTKKVEIWYYAGGMVSARLVVNSRSPGMDSNLLVQSQGLQFSADDQKLFFEVRQGGRPKIDPDSASVDIWNYQDEFIQSEQLRNARYLSDRSFKAVVNLHTQTVIRLENENDGSYGQPRINHGNNDDFLVTESKVNYLEDYRLIRERPDIFLISTKDGSRRRIKEHAMSESGVKFSPAGKYVYWYDNELRAYITYDIQSGKTRNISALVDVPIFDASTEVAGYPHPYGQPVWLQGDKAIVIYDRYDLWRLDPAGGRPPVNLTGGYGRKNKIVLRIATMGTNHLDESPLTEGSTVFLSGFSEQSKYNGFFSLKLGGEAEPMQLIMAPAFFYYPVYSLQAFLPYYIFKAKNADAYLLKRGTASEYPNLCFTRDFVQFKQVSDLAPEKAFSWLTSELVRWTTFDGRPGEGILYKPEDFDPGKQYPIIFYFYESLSDGLNLFMDANLSSGAMNIPWYVSHGYLVFCPDIHYTIGKAGESAYNYVVSAAEMMARKPWVNGQRMGIQGHSFGAFEVDYLVTRTRIFAAAASAAGTSDWVSLSGSLDFGDRDIHDYIEQGQGRLGKTLWQAPQIYIDNSPVFHADRINTPILMMNNKLDGAVPWSQGIEFFLALRRLGKKVWMLQYDNGGHVISEDKDCLDYSIRLNQFFDHYLMGAPLPRWMSSGIPARLKGVEFGLGLSQAGSVN